MQPGAWNNSALLRYIDERRQMAMEFKKGGKSYKTIALKGKEHLHDPERCSDGINIQVFTYEKAPHLLL